MQEKECQNWLVYGLYYLYALSLNNQLIKLPINETHI
jgi:hypothetical protein